MAKKSNGHDVLRVFIGTSPNGEDAEACMVCEHSLRSRASVPVDITFLRLSRDPKSPCYSDPKSRAGWKTEQWGTPWTALRWAVPEICGWEGRAVYFDCPTIILGDVAELAHAPIPPTSFVLIRRVGLFLGTACILFDCAESGKHIPRIVDMQEDIGAHQAVGAMLERRPDLADHLPSGWGLNDTEFAQRPASSLSVRSVCFSSPITQPHMARARARMVLAGGAHWYTGVRLPHYSSRLEEIFESEYTAAVTAGYSVSTHSPDALPMGAALLPSQELFKFRGRV